MTDKTETALNSEKPLNVSDKRQRKLIRKKMIKNYRPSLETIAKELKEWERYTFDLLETEWR